MDSYNIDRDTVRLYFRALEELKNNGDQEAEVAYNFLMGKINYGGEDKPANVIEWAANIHNHT
jgi:hypothetical protein